MEQKLQKLKDEADRAFNRARRLHAIAIKSLAALDLSEAHNAVGFAQGLMMAQKIMLGMEEPTDDADGYLNGLATKGVDW